MANGNGTKLLLFDLDGVIVDSFGLLYSNICRLFQRHVGKHLSEDDYRALFDGNALASVLAGINASPIGFSQEDKEAAFVGYNALPLFDGMKETVERLSAQHPIAIVTSTPAENATAIIDAHGLTDEVAAVVGPEVAVAKDERIRLVMQEFGFSPEQTWYVTDTVGDIVEAKKAGVKTVAVTWGYHDRERLAAATPDAIAATQQDLISILIP